MSIVSLSCGFDLRGLLPELLYSSQGLFALGRMGTLVQG